MQRVALQLVAVVKLTRTDLLYSDPDLRRALLQDLESNEGVRVYPRETTDKFKLQPDKSLNRLIEHDIRSRLGADTVIAQSVNGIPGVWISFKIDGDWVRPRLRPARNRHGPAMGWLGPVRAGAVATRLGLHHQPVEPALLAARVSRAQGGRRADARARHGRGRRNQSQLESDGAPISSSSTPIAR